MKTVNKFTVKKYESMTTAQIKSEIEDLVKICQSCIIFDDYKGLVTFAAEIEIADNVLTQKQQAV